ncbi:hypothetical protein ACET3X_002005 [Alternaria dauci]|uniref:Uncharacterized protein n=1 Tax=Alternaria dauci TaxID=48095 RepID=A0ABR3UYY0_9PLEO
MPELQTRIKDLARFGEPSRWFTVKMYPPPDDKLGTTHREYRYTFKGPPRQMDDPLIRMIIRTIRKLSKDHMLVAAAEIWPHNLDETPPIWPGRAGGATKLYAFTQLFEEFPLAAEICVARGTTTLTAEDILGISGLKHFELFFTSPYGPNRRSTPWYNSGHSNTVEVYPCQKTTVDWILTFRFPYLKDIPNVHLIGSIKSCTKFRWYYILGKEYEQRKLDYRTHGYDQAAEIAVLLEGTMDHAPPCYCPASCVNQPQDLHHFDHDDVYGKPIYTPTLAVGGTSSLRTSAPEDMPASVVKEGFLWSKVLVGT